MEKQREKFVIIDGHALLHRAFHALPPMTTKNGILVNAAYGFTSILLKIIKEIKPNYICAAFDRHGISKRAEEFKEYKAQRKKQPDELYAQIPIIEDILAAFNIPVVDSAEDGYEADDVIGTVVKNNTQNNPEIKNIIVTGDLDTLQLVDNNTEVFTLKKGISDTLIYDENTVYSRYNLRPNQLVDFKALRGDPSDNIPGVKGIGEKTASDLIRQFNDLEKLYENLDNPKIKERIQKLLKSQKQEALLSKKLVTINCALKTNFKLDDAKIKGFNLKTVSDLFAKLEFKSLMNKIPLEASGAGRDGNAAAGTDQASTQSAMSFINLRPAPQKNQLHYQLVNDEKTFNDFLKKLEPVNYLAVDTETTSLNPWQAKLLGISFSWLADEAYYLNIASHREWLKKLSPILENEKIKKTGHNLKYDYEILDMAGIQLKGIAFDTLLAGYLLTAGSRNLDLNSLVFSELGYQMQPIEELIGEKGKNQLNMEDVPLEKISWYSCEDADFSLKLKKRLEPELNNVANFGLLKNIEAPLIPVLADMEKEGIKIDKDFLRKLDKKFSKKIKSLEEKIYMLAGTEFNVASPIQLKEILFDKLNIDTKGLKKIKTGLSTASGELEKLMERHKIIPLISEFREYSKLKNTYTATLGNAADENGRIHTNFNQTVTATGRLSSSDPNLQNIPIRTKIGREIRKAFVAKRGFALISADYSQIELRIIASLANDEGMIESFKKGEDIHARTAANINKINLSEVTMEQRRSAKEVNFGVIYGLGIVGLAGRTGISRDHAKQFIEEYFTLHPKIKKWLENTKRLAVETGFVETLLGRRRYLPDIQSGVQMIRAAAERMAVNAPIQGTAADLLKMAMIKIHSGLPKISANSKMLLTVHDELVLEVPNAEAEEVSQFVKETMENIYALKTPVVAEINKGKNWGECK